MSTPMFVQYHELRAAHPDAILFFRMGDFYEVFFDDAELCSRVLEITLTARNKADDKPIPMAGVPHHAAAGYIQRLTNEGYRVAIAEQVEDPATAKGLVRREVVRVVTPSVVLDPTTLAAADANFLMALLDEGDGVGLAFLDLSTGEFRTTSVDDVDAAVAEIHRMEPREALLHGPGGESPAVQAALRRHGTLISTIEDEAWTSSEALRELHGTLGVADLGGFGVDPQAVGTRAAGAALRYGRDLSGGTVRNVHLLRPYHPERYMVVDDTTRRNLELQRTLLGGKRKGSLLWLIDRTATAMGSRCLKQWMAFPLMGIEAIEARQAAVGELIDRSAARHALREALRHVADVERISARVGQGTAHARDLNALRRSLAAVPEVIEPLRALPAVSPHTPADPVDDLRGTLQRWLADDPPISLTEGGLIRRGVHSELDELTTLSLEGMGLITALEGRERLATKIGSLKVRRNRVFGYYIEVTRAHLHKVPERYIRKQTLTNAERYITPELKELEDRVLGADERRKALEYQLFVQLRDQVADHSERLAALAGSLAELDVLANLAEVAEALRWTRPHMVPGDDLAIEGARHPVVEALLEEERFVPNDVVFADDRRFIILTGPNMAGKSTVMRQVALIALLAQMGSFVPADRATLGLCDRIFTRVGASDDLSRGQSTFMVEMSETASILHHATRRSLVLLDEIGRGTSTYDGLAIAWAVAEDLVDRVGCRGIFATHYHELCELAQQRDGVANQSVAVTEWGDKILFLRTLKEGGASRSYGIQCARLAGLPDPVVQRAKALLSGFEKHAPRNERKQMSLFGTATVPLQDADEAPAPSDPLREALDAIDPDALTPRMALDALYRLKGLET